MKRYTGPLKPHIKQLITSNSEYVKNVLLANKGLNAPASPTYTIDETVKKYNPGMTKDEIQAWVWYRRKQGIPMTSWKSYFINESEALLNTWIDKQILFYDPTVNALVPFAIFTFGNIYEKITQLKRQEKTIVEQYGQPVYDNHIAVLEKNKPRPLSIQNPIVSERPVILAISKLAKTFSILELKDDSVLLPDNGNTLQEAYKRWLDEYPREEIKKVSAWDIITKYLQNARKPRYIDQKEWDDAKKHSRNEGERLFKVFLHEALIHTDQVKLDRLYNEKNNAIAKLNHHKIPIGVEISRMFGTKPLELREAQREGIAFMELVGSGIIAYDVGVGKTMTAVAEMCTAIKNGKCKRPLLIVPDPTYQNWIAEMFGKDGKPGILSGTGIKLNKWHNMGADYKDYDFTKKIEPGTITIVNYNGLSKIGFNQETLDDHFEYLKKIISQEDVSEKQSEKDNEKIMGYIGVGLKDTFVDINDLGIDYICVDEAHNFKNLFVQVKANKTDGKQFELSHGSDPSQRAAKLFFLSNYIQRKYGRNVMLLTATPFTNSPLEIYSMLSLVAYEYMKDNNIEHVQSFFEWFIHETIGYVVMPSGKIELKTVVKSFNNNIALQKLINSHVNFKTGEEAKIKRPCKINIPKTTTQTDDGVKRLSQDKQVLSYLKLNEEQYFNQQSINAEAKKPKSKDDPGKQLRVMGDSLNNALSPFLYSKTSPIDHIDFVENSPKIHYAIKCVESVKQWHEKKNEPVSGQVIYINRGKEYFHYIKEYLEKVVGFKKNIPFKGRKKVDEVEILTGSTNKSNKQKIKDAFNSGQIKILIGTSTIKEGINLQEKSTCLYNLYPDWNPTDIKQLEGRIWRQKNENGYVRIVMPLMENSMDVFVFQKLEEKTARINALWQKEDRGNVLDEDSLDPQEVKFALITDIEVLLDFELQKLKENAKRDIGILNSKLEDVKTFDTISKNYDIQKASLLESIFSANMNNRFLFYKDSLPVYYNNLNDIDVESLTKQQQNIIDRLEKANNMYQDIKQGNHDDKLLIRFKSSYNSISDNNWDRNLEVFKSTLSKYAKIKRSIFKARGLDENTDIKEVIEGLEKEFEKSKKEYEELNTKEYQNKIREEIIEKKRKLAIKGGSLDDRVNEFASLNNLMSYKMDWTDTDSCEIPVRTLPAQPTEADKPKKTDKPKTDDRKRTAIAKAKALQLKIKIGKAKLKLAS